jgi:hypothetical protein
MSSFKTVIPVNTEAVKKLLPPGSFVEKVDFDPQTGELSLHWHHQRLTTPYTFPLDFSLAQLENHELPDKVTDRTKEVAATPALAGPHPAAQAPKQTKRSRPTGKPKPQAAGTSGVVS